MRKIFYLFLVFTCVLLLTSCGAGNSGNNSGQTEEKTEEEVVKSYSIVFDNCGHGESVEKIINAKKIPKTLPTLQEDGYSFDGWYLDKKYTKEAVPGEKIKKDITLYAKWTKLEIHNCEFSGEWKYDSEYHWHECVCGEHDYKVPHKGGVATETERAICEDCGVSYGDFKPHEHDFNDGWKTNSMYHWHECVCGEYDYKVPHKGGVATETERAICEDCGVSYGELKPHEHDFNGEWKTNSMYHWHECVCGEYDYKVPHKGGVATETERAICEDCGVSYGELKPHEHNYEISFDETYHWQECACGDKTLKEPHKGGEATETERAICENCGVSYGELLPPTIVTLYFQNNWEWTDVRIYLWKDSLSNSWPGESVQYIGDLYNKELYSFEIDLTIYSNFIITGISYDGSFAQTIDLEFADYLSVLEDHCFYLNYDADYINACIAYFPFNMNEIHHHAFGQSYNANSTYHWRECNCGKIQGKEPHRGGVATETEQAICSDCGMSYGDLLVHTHKFNSDWLSTGTHHFKVCGCGQESEYIPHTEVVIEGIEPTCINEGKTEHIYCSDCQRVLVQSEVIPALGHTYKEEYNYDLEYHWQECECGDKTEKEAHSGGEATTEELAECEKCGASYGELLPIPTYTITFVINGHGIQPAALGNLTEIPLDLAILTESGYTFAGWYKDIELTTEVVVGEVLIEDITLYAKWTANEYVVTYDVNGGDELDNNTQTVVFGEESNLITPTKVGYYFVGWSMDGSLINQRIWTIASDATLVAEWSPRSDVPYVVNHYFENVDDDEFTLEYTEKFTGTADSTIYPTAYSYTGFNTPNVEEVIIAPDGSLEVNYYYTRKYYSITFITNGGSEIEPISQKYQSTIDDIVTTRDCYTFGGWFTNVNLTISHELTTIEAKDLVLYAYWLEENKPGDFTYQIQNDIVVISGSSCTKDTIVIPEYIGGYVVSTISKSAFKNMTNLIRLTIPKGVTTIEDYILAGCTNLVELTLPFIPSNSKNVGISTLFTSSSSSTVPTGMYKSTSYYQSSHNYYCYVPKYLKVVNVTNTTTLPENAFYGLTNLVNVTLPLELSELGSNAFYKCSSLTSINSDVEGVANLPEGIKTILEYAFYECSSICEYYMSDDITSIGEYAFYNNNSVVKFNSDKAYDMQVPTSCESIGKYAFGKMSSVKYVTIPTKTTTIGNFILSQCSSLEELTIPFIPSNSKNIGISTLFTSSNSSTVPSGMYKTTSYYDSSYNYNCYVPSSLTVVNVTNTTSLPVSAFNNMRNVTTIILPLELIEIGDSAFYNCKSLLKINSDIEGVVNLPEGIKSIPHYAFYKCTQISEIYMSDEIESIGGYSFYECSNVIKFNSEKAYDMIVPKDCNTIGTQAFAKMSKIRTAIIPNCTATIESSILGYCTSLEELTIPFIPSNNKKVGISSLFTSSNSSTVPTGMYKTTSYYESSYTYYCYVPSSLRVVNVTCSNTLPEKAFYNMKNLTTINLRTNAIYGENAFYNVSATVNYTLPNPFDYDDNTVWDNETVATSYESGNGSIDNPLIISNSAEFVYFIKQVNSGIKYSGNYIKLTNDINLGGYQIDQIKSFGGNFDGNGHKIYNYSLNISGFNVGLFETIERNATVSNLELNFGKIEFITDKSVYEYTVGGLVATNIGDITNCYVTGSISLKAGNDIRIGGIVGYNIGNVENCYSNVSVYGLSEYSNCYSGGVAGINAGYIKGSLTSQNVTAKGLTIAYSYVGAISGYTFDDQTSDCYVLDAVVLKRYEATYTTDYYFETKTTYAEIKEILKEKWDNSIWSFIHKDLKLIKK